MTAGDHSDTTCLASQWIEIDMKLDENQTSDAVPSIVVPICVTAVVVAAAPYVVEVIAQQRTEYPDNVRMIEKSTEARAFVKKGNKKRTLRTVMYDAILLEDIVVLSDNPIHLIG